MNFKCIIVTGVLALAQVGAYAQDAATTPQRTDELPHVSPIQISGTLDAYYRFATDKSASLTAFNRSNNGFALGMADVNVSKTFGKAGFSASLSFGERAELIGYSLLGRGSLAALRQAFVFYKPTERLKLTLGTFNTHIGYELNEPTNLNYSQSYMFSNGPFFHTGAKAEYAFSEHFSAMVGVFDDTDSKNDAVKGKHIGAQLAYQKGKWKAFLNFLSGKDLDTLRGQQFDLVVNYQPTSKLALGANLTTKQLQLSGQDAPPPVSDKSWGGGALYATYQFSEKASLAARHEFFADPNAFFYGADETKINASTLSLNWKLNDLTVIPEIRFDAANRPLFGEKLDKKQAVSFLFATVYKF